MPHDKNNQLLKVGDEVVVRFKIKSLCEGEEFCNVTLETVDGRKPDGLKETWSAVNTAVAELVPV